MDGWRRREGKAKRRGKERKNQQEEVGERTSIGNIECTLINNESLSFGVKMEQITIPIENAVDSHNAGKLNSGISHLFSPSRSTTDMSQLISTLVCGTTRVSSCSTHFTHTVIIQQT